MLATNLDFSRSKNPNLYCAQMRSKGSRGVSAPSALRCSASLHPPLAALGSAPPFPSPAAGEGPSGQIAACSTRRLGSVTSCYRFAVTPHKMRRRHLESVSAALYGSTFQLPLKSPIRIQPQLKRKGVLGHSPKCVLVWGPRRDARPAGERRSGGALEGYPKRKRGDPTWSAARDDAHIQK